MTEYLGEAFVWRALAGSVLIVLMAAPLGCFVVWQRMAYFGDALAHSALLGVALGLFMGINPSWSVLLCCLVVAGFLLLMQKHQRLGAELSVDTHLGIVAHAGLAIGFIVLSFVDTFRFDLEAYLFGDVLTVLPDDLWRMVSICILIAIMLVKLWKPLLLVTISEDIAQVEGVSVARLRSIFLFMLALVVATAIQVVGVLLTASLLIIPAAAARRLSNTPEKMVMLATLIGLVAVVAGVMSSLVMDLPAAPAIVLVALVFFIVAQLKKN